MRDVLDLDGEEDEGALLSAVAGVGLGYAIRLWTG
jgi:hypothetical protein